MRISLLLGTVGLLGCGNGKGSDTPGTILVDGEEEVPTLVLTLERPTATAGDELGWGMVLVWESGDVIELDAEIASNIEPDLRLGATGIIPIVAGTHTLTATAEYDGETWTADTPLGVTAAAVATVDLGLSDLAFPAGSAIDWEIGAWDAYGNVIDTAAVSPELDSADASVDGSTLTSTMPGAYTATASVDGVSDREVFVVTPDAADSVVLTLSDEDLELYETTHGTVTVIDAYGNPTADDWTISVDGTGVSAVSHSNVTFFEEGLYTVRVDVDDTGLWDEVGPLLIDSTGPLVEIDEPDRGGWVEGVTGTVSGTVSDDWSAVTSLTINGDSVSYNGDGSFSTERDYAFGLNVLETSATDADDNASTDTRAVLAGAFEPYGDRAEGGMVVRLHEGDGGLGELESLADGVVSAIDLSTMIPSPVVDMSQDDCYTVLWWEVCVTWYSIQLYVDNPTMGATSFSIDPTAAGVLDSTFTVDDIELDWRADATVVFIDYSGSGSITADSIDVGMDLVPFVVMDQLYVGVEDVTVDTTNFYFDMDSWLYDVLDFFGLDTVISGLIAGYLESAIEDVIYDTVPDLLEDALAGLEIAFSFDILGNTYDMEAIPDAVTVDDTGLTLSLSTIFTAASWEIDRAGLGSLYADYTQPAWTGSPGTIFGVSLDFINQALFAFWGGGLLDMQMTGDDLGLDVSELSTFLPGMTALTITTEALLPPVVVPGTSAGLLDFQLGDLLLTLYNGDATPGNEMIQVYVTVIGDMDMSTDGSTLSASLGDMELYFDVVHPDANSIGAADTEALLEALVPLILPSLTDALGEIPIPDMAGFGVSSFSIALDGAEDGYLTLGGDLAITGF